MSAPLYSQYSTGYRWYVLAVLTLGYIFNFIDRQVMTILLEPIKAEFGATDTQMGLLTGLAFALSMPPPVCQWRGSLTGGPAVMCWPCRWPSGAE